MIAWLVVTLAVVAWAWTSGRRRRRRNAQSLLTSSFQQIAAGQLAEAEKTLERAASDALSPGLRRLAQLQRAIVAIRRGDLEVARVALDGALAVRPGPFERGEAAYQREGAHALRAFVRASLRQREGAVADIAAVRRSPGVSADALARASLAEAMLLEQAGERAALKALLTRDRALLLEQSHPRERAIVRAYQRMLKSTSSSVYRAAPAESAAPREGEEPDVADWVARIAPGAAAFVRAPAARRGGAAPAAFAAAPSRGAREAVLASRERGARAARPSSWLLVTASLVGVGLLAGLGLFIGLLANASSYAATDGGSLFGYALLALAAAGTTGMLARQGFRLYQRRAARTRTGPMSSIAHLLALGDLDGASLLLAPLADSPFDLVAAQAHLQRAMVAERRGDFAACLAAAELGLGRLRDVPTRTASGMLWPDLMAERAFALAVNDRTAEAQAELAWLAGSGYPHHARAAFRVRLVELARAGQLDAAAEWASELSADLPLSVREELLADLVRALAAPAETGAGEQERLRDELAMPENHRWIAAVAPKVLEAFERPFEDDATTGLRVAGLDEEDPDVDEAAEAEAAADEARPAPQRR